MYKPNTWNLSCPLKSLGISRLRKFHNAAKRLKTYCMQKDNGVKSRELLIWAGHLWSMFCSSNLFWPFMFFNRIDSHFTNYIWHGLKCICRNLGKLGVHWNQKHLGCKWFQCPSDHPLASIFISPFNVMFWNILKELCVVYSLVVSILFAWS